MTIRTKPHPAAAARRPLAALLGLAMVVGSACGPATGTSTGTPPGATPGATPGTTPASSAAATPTPAAPVALTVGLGYIPSVQFAPFYLADQAGYYRDAGLQVTFENKIDPELVTLVGQGAVDVGIADGTSVIPAVSQDIPIRYVFTLYAQFPSIVFARKSSGIATAADLRGRRIGIPGKYGSSWIQLQALLAGAGLSVSDVEVVTFPDFGQLAALQQGVVDAATGFVNNEPVRLELEGIATVVLALPADAQLPGNGLIVGRATLDGPKGDAIGRFVVATRRAMEDIISDPEKGFDAAAARIPELLSDRPAQLAVMRATIDAWQSAYTAANGLGAIDGAEWARSIAFMSGLPDAPVARPVTVADCIDSRFAAP